jgi:hypothetical protein
MAMHALIEDFTGDPDELYILVTEEINKRELPGFAYSWYDEVEGYGFFTAKGAKAKALKVTYRDKDVGVLGYQTGRIFNVLMYATRDIDPAKKMHKSTLYDLTNSVYDEVVRRSVKAALRRHLEARQAPIPKELDLAGIFLTPEKAERAETAA